MPQRNRKSEQIRRANRVIQSRSFILMLVMGVLLFVVLFFKLYQLQIGRHDELQKKAINQQVRSTVVTASRGTIYDASGNILAISSTAETVFLDPNAIDKALSDTEKPVAWTRELIAQRLGEILGISEDSILEKMERTYSQYEVLKLRVDEDVANEVRSFINEYSVKGIYLSPDAKRYYPYGTLASQVIGFVGTDNTGLYGLEAQYEDQLEGQTGLVVTARDNAGNDLLYEYEQYHAAQNGSNLVLTLDATVQYYLEKGIEEMLDQFDAKNGATGIVMNAKTGGILAMASYPNYDLNDASTVQDARLRAAIEDGSASLSEMQLRQWRNKALNDTYEPGSTFKILTLAAALEEGVIDESTTVNCTGSINVMGSTIRCSNHDGHGQQSLVETVAHSCNPAFITYGLKVGTEKYYDYMKSFGLMEQTGIDLGGEATGIFASPENMTQLDLACYAFGQNCNVTPVALIAAQAACINGGYLHTPYLVDQITDSDGNVTYQHDSTATRQVVSEQTSAKVRECLEYVVSSGTGKNGQVTGYRIGGKTATSEIEKERDETGKITDTEDRYTASFIGVAPMDDPQIAVLVAINDLPESAPHGGGAIAAPVVGRIMEDVLPYIGVTASYDEDESDRREQTVPNVIGMTRDAADEALTNSGFEYIIHGEGETVTDQVPSSGIRIPASGRVILYMGEEKPTEQIEVPDVSGMDPDTCRDTLEEYGLYLKQRGVATSQITGDTTASSQSPAAGTKVSIGSVITVEFSDTTTVNDR